MIFKRILISMIVIISLIQFITSLTTTETKPKDPAVTNTEVKQKGPAKSKSATTTTDPTEVGINPDEDTAKIPEKSTSLRHKFIIKPLKSIVLPFRFLWGKLKNFMNKRQNKNKKETAKSAVSESRGEYADENNKIYNA
ncbi:uncharacterized protein LOC132950622 [Metopolophium dirhodum]|uniref:uncharacterized protein LOC132950622 n=1 Tax=Metopolophium dirhodum TaxID=44670 RepID=UPI0029904AC7|nr:uncharacterized protein LOC132950622 [Metopolophium dirhodum]